MVFPKHRIVIFVNGYFRHRYPYCRHANIRPASNEGYWNRKLNLNIERDAKNKIVLERLGWRVLEVWECKTKKSGIKALT